MRADEGWILTRPGAIMVGLCESTVWGMASVLTLTSWLASCLSPRLQLPYRFSGSMSRNDACVAGVRSADVVVFYAAIKIEQEMG